jgi:Leucine-rich repeat (LRR) protein
MFYTMGTVEKGIFKDTESFHEALIPKIEEDDSSETVTTVIFEPESLLTLAIKAVAKTMKFNRSLLPNSLILRRLQPFFKPIVAREYLSRLNPVGSKLFLEEAPKIAFQELPTISLNYVKFLYYDMESFLYFTTMSSKIVRLELSNNRLDPTSLDMINTQISNGIWPKIRYLDFSFNKIDTTGLQNFFLAVARGIEQIEFIKLSGCNITSTSAQSVAKFIESTNTLQELDISFNAIQAIGIEHIARVSSFLHLLPPFSHPLCIHRH